MLKIIIINLYTIGTTMFCQMLSVQTYYMQNPTKFKTILHVRFLYHRRSGGEKIKSEIQQHYLITSTCGFGRSVTLKNRTTEAPL